MQAASSAAVRGGVPGERARVLDLAIDERANAVQSLSVAPGWKNWLTAVRSRSGSLPFANMRCVNSPAMAGRKPLASPSIRSAAAVTAIDPCVWISTTSSPVLDRGPAITRTSASSSGMPLSSKSRAT